MDHSDRAQLSGAEARGLIRAGTWRRPAAGMAEGYVQANLVVLPQSFADDFLRFCRLNPKACPVLDIVDAGCPEPRIAPGADVRVDLPSFRVYRHGVLDEVVHSITSLWRSDFVTFLLGCSFTFEKELVGAGVPLRHVDLGCNVSMYRSNRRCRAAGPFRGPLVVSMRPIPEGLVETTIRLTERFPKAHGAPIHVGDCRQLGIDDLSKPDYGDAVPVYPGEVPVFWACGVTPQAAAESVKIEVMITHAPGHMFITDLMDEELRES